MKSLKAIIVFSLAIAIMTSCAPRVRAQEPPPEPAWQVKFPKAINWFARTSAGILLVRSGKTLTAIDAVDGKQLWKMDRFDSGGEMERGQYGANMLEIPGLPILLINFASLPDTPGHFFLGVNLWTGEILWRKPAIDDLVQVIPFYDTGKIILVTAKYDKAVNTAVTMTIMLASSGVGLAVGGIAGSVIDLTMASVQDASGTEIPLVYHPVIQSVDPLTGAVNWSVQYPRTLMYGFATFRLIDGQLYLHAHQGSGPGAESIQGRVDLSSGAREWDTVEKYHRAANLMPELQLDNGRLISAAESVQAIEPTSGKIAWQTPNTGRVANLLVKQGLVVGSGGKTVFALDQATGAQRWSIPADGMPTNLLSLDEQNAIVFCDKSHLVVADVLTGKIIRSTPLQMKSPPRVAMKIGTNFVLVTAPKQSSLYDVTTGKKLWSAQPFAAEFPEVNFLVSHTFLGGPAWVPEDDLRQQIREGWNTIQQSAANEPAAVTGVDRLKPFLDDPETHPRVVFESPVPADPQEGFDVFEIDTQTGALQEYGDFEGLQPDASDSLGRIYFIDNHGLSLTALTLPHKK
jgi:outer membrane protein assembly factor BamB